MFPSCQTIALLQARFGGQSLTGTVTSGKNVVTKLGRVELNPGAFDMRVSAAKITGQELMRLHFIVLDPINDK